MSGMTMPLGASQSLNRTNVIRPTQKPSSQSHADVLVPDPLTATDAFVRHMRDVGIVLGSTKQFPTPAFHVENLASARRLLAASSVPDATVLEQFTAFLSADESRLTRVLRPVLVRSSLAGNSQAPSLARLLLGHARLQSPIAALLLERFCVSIEDEERFARADLCENMPKLILRQLRLLECVRDGPALASKLVEVLSAVPAFAKRELLACLPDIVDDSSHAVVVPALQLELEQSPELAVPILDAIAQINVDPRYLVETRRAAVGLLRATHVTDTPLVVRFLILSAPADSCNATVDTLREQLTALLDEGALSERGAAAAADDDEYRHHGKSRMPSSVSHVGKVDAVALLIDSLRLALAARRDVVKAWTAKLEAAVKRAAGLLEQGMTVDGMLGVCDVWFLLCMHANGPDGARDADALIRRLVINELLNSNVLCGAVCGEFAACVELLGASATALAGSLVRGAAPAHRQTGCAFYRVLFGAMKSIVGQTGLISALVTHVGSAAPLEIDAALLTLVELAETRANVSALLQLVPFVNGLLDYLECLSDAQVRLVFRVYAAIASADDEDSAAAVASVRSELGILVHKQLSHADVTYKRFGVIGAVTHLVRIAGYADGAELSADANDEASELVRALFERASAPPTCLTLLFDELASRVPRLHPLLVSHVLSSLLHVLSPMRECADCDVAEERALWYGHGDGGASAPARCCDVIGAVRLQEQHQHGPQQQQMHEAAGDAGAALAASLRLAQAATRALRTGGIGDSLRTAVHMFVWHAAPASLAPLERMSQARAVFCAGDWLRETASGAALDVLADSNWSVDDARLVMVRERIDDIFENERRLELFLRVLPDFSLPTINGGAPLLRVATKSSGGAGSKRGGARASKSAKSAKRTADDVAATTVDVDDNGDDGGEHDTNGDVDDEEEEDGGDGVPAAAAVAAAAAGPTSAGVVDVGDAMPFVGQLRPMMRELDVAVFAALAHRGPIGALCIEALANDFAGKLAAQAALEKPLTARRVINSGASMFLEAHTPVTALTLLAAAIGALATHATRLHAQLTNRLRVIAAVSDEVDDANAVTIDAELSLPGGVPELALESEVLLAERAFAAICRALTAVFRCSSVRRLSSLRDVLLACLARCICADRNKSAARGANETFSVVFNHFAHLGAALPRLMHVETAAALLDMLAELAEIAPARAHGDMLLDDDGDAAVHDRNMQADVASQLSALAGQWLRASWARHSDGKFRAEPLRRVVHACAHHDASRIGTLRALAHASARFVLHARANGNGDETPSPLPADDDTLESLLPPTHALNDGGSDGEDDDSDVPLSRRVRLVEAPYNTLTSSTWPFWVAAIHSELVSVFRSINTAPSPRYVENVQFICDAVRVWRVVLETCNLGATVHIMRSLMKDGTAVVALIASLTKTYLQQHMIECIEPLSALFADVARCSHLLHAGCETTKDKKDALLAPLVPRAKRMLESLSLTLRAALTANKLSDSFSVFVQSDVQRPKKAKRKASKPPKPKSSPPATARN